MALALRLLLLSCQVLLKVSCSSSEGPWYVEADHYWPMSRVYYRWVYDYYRVNKVRWHGYIRGQQQATFTPPNVGIGLFGTVDSWLDLGSHNNTCYVDINNCTTGLSIALWVKLYEHDKQQRLLVFGGGDRGVSVTQTNDANLEIGIKSAKLRQSWTLRSLSGPFISGQWHHIALTWNLTTGIQLYLNGSRSKDVNTTVLVNQTGWNSSDWSMAVGRDPVTGQYTKMDLDEMALWQHVISNATIKQAYQRKTGVYISNTGCHSGWRANLQFCYQKNIAKKTWSDAKIACKRLHSDLVSVGSKEEYTFVEDTLRGISQCMYIGLRDVDNSSQSFYWTDGTLWSFSKLVNERNTSINGSLLNASIASGDESGVDGLCVYRATDGSWRTGSCGELCGYVCKKSRGWIFRNAEFYCRAKLLDQSLANHRCAIVAVRSELDCAMECLIYSTGCRSYNYQRYSTGSNQIMDRHICELNRSSDHRYLVPRDGYQYCERL